MPNTDIQWYVEHPSPATTMAHRPLSFTMYKTEYFSLHPPPTLKRIFVSQMMPLFIHVSS